MAIQLQLRRGTATQHETFTGASGEVTLNSTNHSIHLHDGSTAGGFELARADFTNFIAGSNLEGVNHLSATDVDFGTLTTTGDIHFGADLYVTGKTELTGALTVYGNLTVLGESNIIDSTITRIVDPVIQLGGANAGGTLGSNDGYDRGIAFKYYSSGEKIGFMGYDNSATQYVLLTAATENTNIFSGTYAPLRMGALTATSGSFSSTLGVTGVVTLTDTTTSSSKTTGALKVAGGVGIAGTLYAGATHLDSLVLTSQLAITQGGTGQTTPPEVGQLLIGNSSNGFTLNRLQAGDYIQITNNSGSISIAYTGTSGNSAIFAPQATSDLGFVYDTNIIAEEDLGAVGGAVPVVYDLGPLRLDGVVSLSNLDQSVKSDYLGYSIIFGF
jgi:Major tropism determinant N-terminal domain